MAESDTPWLKQPDDPRYKAWQIIRGSIQRDESQAMADCLASCLADIKANGLRSATLISEIITLVERQCDTCGRAASALVDSVARAEEAAVLVDEVVELLLDSYTAWFQEAEKRFPVRASALLTESRSRLTVRSAYWKAVIFQRGIDRELSGNSLSNTATGEHSADGQSDGLSEQRTKCEALKLHEAPAPAAPGQIGRPKAIPINTKKLRHLQGGLTQDKFAERCGVSVDTIRKGSLAEGTIRNIALRLGVPAEELML